MMINKKNVGACYKRPNGTTYTRWWLGSGFAWYMTAEQWARDKVFFDTHLKNLGIGEDRLMCIVWSK